jgi:hypothetical protein
MNKKKVTNRASKYVWAKWNGVFFEKSFSDILKTGHGKGKSGPTTTVGKQRYR